MTSNNRQAILDFLNGKEPQTMKQIVDGLGRKPTPTMVQVNALVSEGEVIREFEDPHFRYRLR